MTPKNKSHHSKSKISQKCKKIKLVLTDVDGVLTDGGMYYSDKGELLKKFNTRDGMGVELLRKRGIKTVFVTKEKSEIVKRRAKKLKVLTLLGLKNKELILPKICKKFNVRNDEIAYIGDDINDLEIMKHVGFSATPADGNNQLKQIADYICRLNGGDGSFREITDLIISK